MSLVIDFIIDDKPYRRKYIGIDSKFRELLYDTSDIIFPKWHFAHLAIFGIVLST